MKLDDAGAAFFAEGVTDEEELVGIPPELATSPLPNSYFPPHWESKGIDEKSPASVNRSLLKSFNEETNANESSTSNSTSESEPITNTYKPTPKQPQVELGEEAMEEEAATLFDTSVPTKEGEANVGIQTESTNTNRGKLNRKKRKRRSMNIKHARTSSKSSIKDIVDPDLSGANEVIKCEGQSSDDIFDMDDVHNELDVDMAGTPTPTNHKSFDIRVYGLSTANAAINITSTSVPSTPVAIVPPAIIKDETYSLSHPVHSSLPRLEEITAQTLEDSTNPSNEAANLKGSSTQQSCMTEHSFLSSRLPDQKQLDSMFAPDGSEDSDEGNKKVSSKRDTNLQYFSEPETYSPITSPIGSRPGSPIMSDSEIMSESSVLRKAREKEGKERGEQSWEWGQLPSTTTTPAQDKSPKLSQDQKNADKPEESKTETSAEDSRWTFLWFRSRSESTNKRNKDEENPKKDEQKEDKALTGVPLESLKTDEEIQKYIGSHFHGSSKPRPMAAGRASSYSQLDSDAESGNGPSLPMSPHSVEGAIGGECQYDPDYIDDRHFR